MVSVYWVVDMPGDGGAGREQVNRLCTVVVNLIRHELVKRTEAAKMRRQAEEANYTMESGELKMRTCLLREENALILCLLVRFRSNQLYQFIDLQYFYS